MTPEIAVELIKIIPSLIWTGIFIMLVIVFYRPIKDDLIPNIGGIKAFGVDITFIKNELDKAAKDLAIEATLNRDQVARRAQRVASLIKGARILIVNDVPSKMRYVIRILRSLKVKVDVSTSTTEALAAMSEISYDVVISDIRRGNVEDEGLRFLKETVQRRLKRPTIFLVANLEPERGVPLHAFGITNQVDELFNLVFDAIERVRG